MSGMLRNAASKIQTGWVLTVSVVVVLLLPFWMQQGMFVDGVSYAAISRNLAHSIGTFWQPHYTDVKYPVFFEHPPLVFGIQSLFFRFFGDGFLTERLYCLFTALGGIAGLTACYHVFTGSEQTSRKSWLPVLLWVTIPVVFWSLRNNILENTLSIFTLFAVFFFTRAEQKKKRMYWVWAALCIVGAFFCKGFVGLFPLVVPLLFFLLLDENRSPKGLLTAGVAILITLLCFAGVFLFIPSSLENIHQYLNQQLLPALQNKREITAGSHFELLGWLALQLAFPIILCIAALGWLYVKKIPISSDRRKHALYFLLIGLSASLPLMITLKQRTFYLYPGMPFFILAAVEIIEPLLDPCIRVFNRLFVTRVRIVSFFLFAASLVYALLQYGKFSRDEVLLHDVYIISKAVPSGTVLGCKDANQYEWALVAYCSRIGNLSLEGNTTHTYYLLDTKEDVPEELMKSYEVVDLPLQRYTVLKRKN